MKTERKSYPRGLGKGTWGLRRLDNKPVAVFNCPGCGITAYLEEHSVDSDGNVTPSVVCPGVCGFHEFIHLKGWSYAID
jgi:hypothetical protein